MADASCEGGELLVAIGDFPEKAFCLGFAVEENMNSETFPSP